MSEENLSYKLLNAKEAFKTLEIAYKYYSKELDKIAWSEILELKKITRDSVIQRFEYTVETLWKFLYVYLKDRHGLYDSAISPKNTFREALKTRLVTSEEVELAIEMVNDRNLASHTYKEETAEQIVSRMPAYIKLIRKLLQELEQNL
ncbi:MAG: nucleotidyltransferase substrate binding protein [Candidatus Caenarcaniphilales bacterium]|jgi:nucleotidyltransferase substrate binding protein (TIGR01987 family)|nr:nucleotidyltransferase substrate binding protein [Candidatus Caenarcaniphilales bacterium]